MLIFNLLGGALANQQRVLLADVADNRVIKVVAGVIDAGGLDDFALGDNGNVGDARAHVHNHAAVALAQIHADAKRRRERTVKQIGTLHARVQQDVDEGVLLRLGHAGRDAHDDARPGEQALGQHTVQKEAEHGVRQLKIRDGAPASAGESP